MKQRIVIFAKEKPILEDAVQFLKRYQSEIILFKGKLNDPFPQKAFDLTPDWTVSFLSPWILPEPVLKATKKWAINFHPGPPEYPGTGCTNFALYHREKTYGVTAHIMEPTVDSGKILATGVFNRPIKTSKNPDADHSKRDQEQSYMKINPGLLCRFLAKIAHGCAVADRGLGNFEPYLLTLILGDTSQAGYLVGGSADVSDGSENSLHEIRIQYRNLGKDRLVVVQIQLFSFLSAPVYQVVAGRLL